jgi:hypothetical protein
VIAHTDLARKEVAAPTVVIAADHEDVDAGIANVGEGGERAKVLAGDDRSPLEPEIEQVAVDDQRPGGPGNVPEKVHQPALELAGPHAEMRIPNDVAGRG